MHPKFYVYHKDNPDTLCPVIETLCVPMATKSGIIGAEQHGASIFHLFCIVYLNSVRTKGSNIKWVQSNECIIATHSIQYGDSEVHILLDAEKEVS